MRLSLLILTLICAGCMPRAIAKDSLEKYQKLALQLNELCKSQANEVDLIRAIRKAGGIRGSRRPSFVKTNAINFPQGVKLRILKDGNWDLSTEEPSESTFFQGKHYAPTSKCEIFAFKNAMLIDPCAVGKTDRPTMVVFTPNKVIVVATEYKQYYLLERPDLEFARIKYRSSNE